MKKKAQIINLGCRLNSWEGEVIRDHIGQRSDLVVVNSCAVTKEAERQTRQMIRRSYRNNPQKNIVVTGCAAQLSPEKYKDMPGVRRVLGNHEKLQAQSWEDKRDIVEVSDIQKTERPTAHLVKNFVNRTRACVQIQQGCNHSCTFCVIPKARGQSRSVTIGSIIKQIQRLVESHHYEIVLTGVDVASWGEDLRGQPVLGQLCRRILQEVPHLKRLRLSSIDPAGMDEDLWVLLEREERFMPYLHLSLQSGSDMILKRMKRRHNRRDVGQLLQKARSFRPLIGIGADLIAGFPTESERFFAETCHFLQEQGIPYLHVFPYSERPGTPAELIAKKVPKLLRKKRAKIMREIGYVNLLHYLRQFLGRNIEVLVEKDNKGRSKEFAPVQILGEDLEIGKCYAVRVLDIKEKMLIAKRIS